MMTGGGRANLAKHRANAATSDFVLLDVRQNQQIVRAGKHPARA
jgi:hypothetical protein